MEVDDVVGREVDGDVPVEVGESKRGLPPFTCICTPNLAFAFFTPFWLCCGGGAGKPRLPSLRLLLRKFPRVSGGYTRGVSLGNFIWEGCKNIPGNRKILHIPPSYGISAPGGPFSPVNHHRGGLANFAKVAPC